MSKTEIKMAAVAVLLPDGPPNTNGVVVCEPSRTAIAAYLYYRTALGLAARTLNAGFDTVRPNRNRPRRRQ
jgi:hypothetical protein